jgi:hypothetical protein
MSDDTYQAWLEECRRQQRARRAQQRAPGTAEEFVEITTTQMDRGWVVYDPGMPGTVAAQRGGFWWCVRCFRPDTGQPDFASSHICDDIVSGGRRWVRQDLVPDVRPQSPAGDARGDSGRTTDACGEIRARRA